ncbi:hypothetical protein [Streptococcus salivarius]|uniref:hypothetical protein n=1 Tax=Streptococcus salivarius TaxID=1304 RepID=UPI00093E2C88|nr:hypothetical protein [Streptococcus salivarius]
MVIVSGLVGAILSALIAIYVSLLGRNSSLDSSSKWREGLLNVASKYQLTKDDAQRVRSSLRMFKHDNKEIVTFSFDWFTNIMIAELEKILSDSPQKCKECNKEFSLKSDDIKVVRLFANFLLKYHYEYQSEMGPNQLILGKKKRNNQENDLVRETFEELWKVRNQRVKGFNYE